MYVDDILITGNDTAEISALKSFLHSTFQIKDLGQLNYFLGIEVLHEPNGVILTQRKFAKDLVQEFSTHLHHSVSSPLPAHLQLNMTEGAVFEVCCLITIQISNCLLFVIQIGLHAQILANL